MYKIVIQEERERLKSEYIAWRAGKSPAPEEDHLAHYFSERRASSLISKGKTRSARVVEHHVMFAEKPAVVTISNMEGTVDEYDPFVASYECEGVLSDADINRTMVSDVSSL
jgi:hypothetical protein